MAKSAVDAVEILKWDGLSWQSNHDLLAVEEPMEIRIYFGPLNDRKEKSISITMRTPGNDFELAIGFLFTEGIIHSKSDILSIRYCLQVDQPEATDNIVRVELSPDAAIDTIHLDRHFYTGSSCGICGKASLEAIQKCHPEGHHWAPDKPALKPDMLCALPDILRAKQAVFKHTGGLHACALFNTSGELLYLREDIGRHNALDKLIGAALQTDLLPLHQSILLLSGRAGFEMIQKAHAAGIPFVAAVGAPSSLARDTAASTGMTLVGFLRDNRFNVYSGKERIQS